MTAPTAPRLILASGSAARREMLSAAGVPFAVQPSTVDEAPIQKAHGDQPADRLALELARAKALDVSRHDRQAWVLGADQTLSFAGGQLHKAHSLDEARDRLKAMRGAGHDLHSAAALARDGRVVWAGVDTATLWMREFSDGFLDAYLAAEGEGLLSVVGSYRLEGRGAQLFDRIEGDHFTILGLPLWPVLDQLRRAGVIET